MSGETQVTAAIYARLSSDKRKGSEDEGKTVHDQIADCRAFITRKGWIEGEVYRDNDVSATDGGIRPDFERLLLDAPPIVVAWRASRLSRDLMDTLRIKTAGITGYLTDGGTIDFSSGDAEMLTMIRSIVDATEGRKKSEFQQRRNLSDARAGRPHLSRPVFGNDYRTGKLIPNEAEAIRKAARAYVAGETSFYQIAKEWNAQGFRTPRTKNIGGKEWEVGTVRNFFMRERLIGKRVYRGETHKLANWQPVLEEATFEDIQTLISSTRTGKRGVRADSVSMHLLTGICRCYECGKGMNIGYRGGTGSPRYYKCTTPNHVSRTAAPLERYVVEIFLYLLAHPGAESAVSPGVARKDSGALRVERAQLLQEYDAWVKEAIEQNLSPKTMKIRETKHEERLAEIESSLMDLNKRNLFDGLMHDFAEAGTEGAWTRWEAIPGVRRRKIVEALIASVTVHRAPQGTRFSPRYITVRPTPLLLHLTALANDSVTELTWKEYKNLQRGLTKD